MQQCTTELLRRGTALNSRGKPIAMPKVRSRSRSHDKDKEAKKKKQQPNGTKNNTSSSRLPFAAAAVIGVLAAGAAYWRNDAEAMPWQPRPSDAYKPLRTIGGVLIEDFVPPRIIEALRAELEDAVNRTCAAPTMVCFDPARVDVETGRAASLLPPWLLAHPALGADSVRP